MSGIHKAFVGVKALDDVDLRLFPGEVHALMGENGAGKSTLIKVLTGVYDIDAGEITLEGRPVRFGSPMEAQRGGVSTVYQEVNLCTNLSVAENLFLGREPRRLGRIQWRAMRKAAAAALARVNLDLDVGAQLATLLARGPADGRDRPRRRHRREGADPRRADLRRSTRARSSSSSRSCASSRTRASRSSSSPTSSTRSTRSPTA